METSGLTVRFASPDEADSCNRLHNRLFEDERSLEQWRWDFVSTLFEHQQIPYSVVDDAGAIVGTQALIPIRMINEQGIFWTAKSEETLIDPAYRGKRLFEKMYDQLFAYAADNDLRYIWGFTMAEKAFRRLGFTVPALTSQLIFPFYCRRLDLLLKRAGMDRPAGFKDRVRRMGLQAGCVAARTWSAARFARSARRVRRCADAHGLQLRPVGESPEGAGALCSRFVEQWGGTTIYRDQDYLRWRVFENPYLKPLMWGAYDGEELVGWVIFSVDEEGVGYLVDVIAATGSGRPYEAEDVVRALLVEAVRRVRNMGAVAMRGWHVNEHPFARIVTRVARRVGFHHVKRGQSVVLYDTAREGKQADCDFANWYVTRIFMEGTVG